MGQVPPIHMPLALEAANLSLMRSAVTSRSNWANDSRTLSVSGLVTLSLLTALSLYPPFTPSLLESQYSIRF